jgi:hypothetical protein
VAEVAVAEVGAVPAVVDPADLPFGFVVLPPSGSAAYRPCFEHSSAFADRDWGRPASAGHGQLAAAAAAAAVVVALVAGLAAVALAPAVVAEERAAEPS